MNLLYQHEILFRKILQFSNDNMHIATMIIFGCNLTLAAILCLNLSHKRKEYFGNMTQNIIMTTPTVIFRLSNLVLLIYPVDLKVLNKGSFFLFYF